MIPLPTLVVRDVLIAGEKQILSDIDHYVPLILGSDSQYNTDLTEFLNAGIGDTEEKRRYRIKKYLGFPSTEPQLPAWAITLGISQEQLRGIGGFIQDATQFIKQDASQNWFESGSYAKATVSIGCYAANPIITEYLYALATFILLGYRETLEETYGFHDQMMTAQDLMATPENYPVFSFVRRIDLNILIKNSIRTTVESLQGITITSTWKDANQQTLDEIETQVGDT